MSASLTFEALGGRCELYADDGERLVTVRSWLTAMHDRLTRFSEASELSRFNRAAGGGWVEVSAELEALLRASLEAFAASAGLVHVGILPALIAAGYVGDFAAGPAPATGAAAPIDPLPEMLAVRPGEARLAAGTSIDLGGIAKGWLADRSVERIGGSALANLAGDLRASGGGPHGDGWPIGFGGTTVLLRDIGAATSGTTARRWGEDLHHLIDPRTGRPARTDLGEVSVLAPTATEAEILAKTALLLGREAGARYLDGRALGSYLVPA